MALSNIMDGMEEKLTPLAKAITENKYLMTLRDTFAVIMPLLIVGSLFTLAINFPIDAWTNLLSTTVLNGVTLSDIIGVPATLTVSSMALYVAFFMGYNYAGQVGLEDRVSAGVVSLVSWLLLMPISIDVTADDLSEAIQISGLSFDWLGSKGIFVAIIVGFLATALYVKLMNDGPVITMPAGVPPTVSRSFTSLIPMGVTMVVVWAVRVIFVLSPWGNAFNFVYEILQVPLLSLGGNVVAQAIICAFGHFLWFFGIHGTSLTSSVNNPILLTLSSENQEAIAAGLAAPNVMNQQFVDLFATMGGAGSTLSLVIIMVLFCRSERIKKLAHLSIAPAIFNINEPIIFGLPIVLDPVMFIPFILAPVVNIFVSWAAMSAGIVPICSGVYVTWTTPAIISGFLVSGWQGAVLQAVLILIDGVVFFPFIKALDSQYLREEQELSSSEADGQNALDSLDLDSLDLDSL